MVAKGYGGAGVRLDRSNEANIRDVITQAQKDAKNGTPVLINCLIGKTNFRDGSISV